MVDADFRSTLALPPFGEKAGGLAGFTAVRIAARQ